MEHYMSWDTILLYILIGETMLVEIWYKNETTDIAHAGFLCLGVKWLLEGQGRWKQERQQGALGVGRRILSTLIDRVAFGSWG